MSENKLKEPICIYSEEPKKSEWKPEYNQEYFTPDYRNSMWVIRHTICLCCDPDNRCINKGETFQTAEACGKYMNAKGWYNDNPWEV